ncbi:MAG TPA: gliding-motility protein MglA [Deltaproteobacteria bacterium]|nr:MAG: hypothetical protein A2048_04480 [Deltaproteobacteria bacterium GWA2_45_12]HBF12779.1 gliding-motility protein MglA [Deltaproteobacteria bacterium]
MAVIDSNKKEINFKIVYYGPARSGKTSSIHAVQEGIQVSKKSKIKKNLETDKTIFFDFLALSSEAIGGYKTKFQVYTVPGQVLYEDSRKLLLKGVDGLLFVADSRLEKLEDNIRSMSELRDHLQAMGYVPGDIPTVLQYNKRDLPSAPQVDELRKTLNIYHWADFETVAIKGQGVVDAFKECVRQVVLNLKEV